MVMQEEQEQERGIGWWGRREGGREGGEGRVICWGSMM